MSLSGSFPDLMARLRAGEDAAVQEVLQRFTGQLIALARRQFNAQLRHKIDPEDIVQSAYKSFFVRHDKGKVAPTSWNSLWSLLTLITLRKCADRVRYHRAERRDASREAPAPKDAERPEPWQEAIDREPAPEEAVMLAETVGQLLGSLDEDERPIIELSLQGHSTQEISRQLGRA